MTYEDFIMLPDNGEITDLLSPLLHALHLVARGDWDLAHTIAQDVHTKEGSWVHAYLHREEGDLSNATYWYSRAGRQMPGTGLKEEWESIVRELLGT